MGWCGGACDDICVTIVEFLHPFIDESLLERALCITLGLLFLFYCCGTRLVIGAGEVAWGGWGEGNQWQGCVCVGLGGGSIIIVLMS